MAFDFHYCVSLSIVHPTADPASITKAITHLRPDIEMMAGTLKRSRRRQPIIPHRTVALSHWSAYCHDEKRLFSGTKPLSEFICECLDKLDQHRSLFATFRPEGEVKLVIGWFSETSHSAGVLSAEALKRCGDLGVDIELDFYAPSDEKGAGDQTG